MKQSVSGGTIAAIVVVVLAILGFFAYRTFGPGSGTQGVINKSEEAKHKAENPMMQRSDPAAMQQFRQQQMQNAAKGRAMRPGMPSGPPQGVMGSGGPGAPR